MTDTFRQDDAAFGTRSARHDFEGSVPASVGGCELIRPLRDSVFGRRYLAYDARRQVDCMIWLFDGVSADRMPGVWSFLRRAVDHRKAHVLPVDAAGRERGGMCWACTPYVGNHEDIVSLESLRNARGGVMSVFETARAVEQLLDASVKCHAAGVVHGAIDPKGVLVTTRGKLEICMYGLRESLKAEENLADVRTAELVSIGEIAWELLTGLPRSQSPGEDDHGLVAPSWSAWIRRACDPVAGFDGPEEALRLMPSGMAERTETRLGVARSLIGRLSSAVSGPKSNRDGTERKKTPSSGV